MTDTNSSLSKLDELKHSTDFEGEVAQTQENIEKLNAELGLQAPHDISDEDKESWELLFTRIRAMYRKGMIEKDNVYGMFEIYDQQSLEQRKETIQSLYKLEKEKEEENSYIDEGLEMEAMRQYLNEVADLFPAEMRADFFYFIEHGKTINEGVEEQLDGQLAENQGTLAYERLQNYLGDEKKTGKILTVSDLVGKFDLDDTGKSTRQYDFNPSDDVTVPKPGEGV